MAKKKDEVVFQSEEMDTPTVTLDQVGYARIKKGQLFEVVRFRFNAEELTMGALESITETHSEYDAADELVITLEDELYQ